MCCVEKYISTILITKVKTVFSLCLSYCAALMHGDELLPCQEWHKSRCMSGDRSPGAKSKVHQFSQTSSSDTRKSG